MSSDTEAARRILEAQRTNRPIGRFPEALRPNSIDEAYAIQDAVAKETGPIGGWKVGRQPRQDEPCCGPVYRRDILPSGSAIKIATLHRPSLEIEFGFRARKDLANAAELSDEQIAAAFDFIPLMEVLGSRFIDPTEFTLAEKLADRQGNSGFVIGQAVTDWRDLDFKAVRVELVIDGKTVQSAMGSHPLANPSPLAVWQARHCAKRGLPLMAGDIVTTGALQGATPVTAGAHAVATWGQWGRVEVRFD